MNFDAKAEAMEVAALWPSFLDAHSVWCENDYPRFMAEQAFKRNWSVLDAFMVDRYFQDGLDEYWRQKDAER